MTDSELNNFVFWYLENQGHKKTSKRFKESVDLELETKEKIPHKQIKNYEKILKKIGQQSKEKL